MDELDFSWGNPYFLLDLLPKHGRCELGSLISAKDCSYGPDRGDSELIGLTRNIIKKTTGLDYKYILITHGATGAINSALRLAKNNGIDTVCTGKFGYPFYDAMIEKARLMRSHSSIKPRPPHNAISLIDSPSNPEGSQTRYGSNLTDIWDAVYHSKIYTESLHTVPGHLMMVGSYSKLFGITGARVGWIATDSEDTYNSLLSDTLHELATVSIFSQKAISNLIKSVDLNDFMNDGKKDLDNNRTQIQKIEYIFDGQPVRKNGMFYLAQADKTSINLLNKCMVKYVELSDNYIRLNIGQSIKVVEDLIYRIHKVDNK